MCNTSPLRSQTSEVWGVEFLAWARAGSRTFGMDATLDAVIEVDLIASHQLRPDGSRPMRILPPSQYDAIKSRFR